MPTYRAMHWFQGASGQARDRFVSSLYFNTKSALAPDGPELYGLMNGVMALFGATITVSGFTNSIFSPYATVETDHVRVYDMSAPKKSPPIAELSRIENQPALVGAQRGLPEEVACCLSFEAVPAAGTNQARRRGRIFLGPLAQTALDTTISTAPSRPNPALIASVFTALSAASVLWSVSWEWMVNSPTIGKYSSASVARAWIDNAWDTQRRRGVDPSEKTYWGV